MLTTLLISLREYLEVFLIIGVFLGISKNLKLGREREIVAASTIGITISFLLPVLTFFAGNRLFSHEFSELFEGVLMIFTGFFIIYVVFSLHKFFHHHGAKSLIHAHEKLKDNFFDLSLFLTIVFFIVREGFEIALFTASTAVLSRFTENITGLALGFLISIILCLVSYRFYSKFPIQKVFKYTELLILILSASLIIGGLSELIDVYR